jgi:hypothetical protein
MPISKRMSLLLLLNIGLTTLALADTTTYYCAFGKNAGYINLGDTMQKVQATCGAPNDNYEQPSNIIQTQQVETWFYTASPLLGSPTQRPPVNIKNGKPETPKPNQVQVPAVSFQISNGKVANITGQPQGPLKQWRCPSNTIIQVGTTVTQLINSCGRPSMVHKATKHVMVQPKNIAYWRYTGHSNQYGQQPVVLTFENGVLVKIQ